MPTTAWPQKTTFWGFENVQKHIGLLLSEITKKKKNKKKKTKTETTEALVFIRNSFFIVAVANSHVSKVWPTLLRRHRL